MVGSQQSTGEGREHEWAVSTRGCEHREQCVGRAAGGGAVLEADFSLITESTCLPQPANDLTLNPSIHADQAHSLAPPVCCCCQPVSTLLPTHVSQHLDDRLSTEAVLPSHPGCRRPCAAACPPHCWRRPAGRDSFGARQSTPRHHPRPPHLQMKGRIRQAQAQLVGMQQHGAAEDSSAGRPTASRPSTMQHPQQLNHPTPQPSHLR